MKVKSILMIADSPDKQSLIQLILEHGDAVLAVANDRLADVNLDFSADYELVQMDIQMPVKDELEAVKPLRLKTYDRPVIVLTAYAMKEEAELAFQSGSTSFLTKPIDREAMIRLVKKLVNKENED